MIACAAGLLGASLAFPAAAAALPNAYVANSLGQDVFQFSLGADGDLDPLVPPTASVQSPARPLNLAVSPDGSDAYATELAVDAVAQFEIGADGGLVPNTLTPVTDEPFDVALTPDGGSAYVTLAAGGVGQFDVGPDGSLTPKAPPVAATEDSPRGITVSPDGQHAYVANHESTPPTISQYTIQADGRLVPIVDAATAPADLGPWGIALTPDGKYAYATNSDADSISQYEVGVEIGVEGVLEPLSQPTVPSGSDPESIAITPDGKYVYVTTSEDGVWQYEIAANGSLVERLPPNVSTGPVVPRDIAIAPDGESVYVTNQDSSVSQFDVAGNGTLIPKTPATVAIDGEPYGIAVRPDTIPPTATILSGPSGTVSSRDARFTFTADDPGSTFRCSIGGAPFSACESPQHYANLADGEHSFAVRATDEAGNTGPAATRTWSVTANPPSNAFSFAATKKNRKRGTAKLTVQVAGPGALELAATKKLKRDSAEAAAAGAAKAGEATLEVKPKRKARKRLKRKGRARVTAKVTFTPDGGTANTQSKALKLIRRR